jgi:hypothetical protein
VIQVSRYKNLCRSFNDPKYRASREEPKATRIFKNKALNVLVPAFHDEVMIA